MHQQLACVLLTPHVNCAPQPGHTESGAREFYDREFMPPMIRAKAWVAGCGLRVAGCGLRVAGCVTIFAGRLFICIRLA